MAKRLSETRLSVPLLFPDSSSHKRGKVSDSFSVPNPRGGKPLRAIYTTDGVSALDFSLDCLIPGKGVNLNIQSVHMMRLLEREMGVRHHLLAVGAEVDEYLPPWMRGNPDTQSRLVIARELKMLEYEFVARGEFTGSALKNYRAGKLVCGHRLPSGLEDGDSLPFILDTPTTKAEIGHDEEVDAAVVRAEHPEATYWTIKILAFMRWYAMQRSYRYADSKVEWGIDENGTLLLCDKVASGDEVRAWLNSDWEASRRRSPKKAPQSFDKQPIRDFLIAEGVGNLDPADDADIERVWHIRIPGSLISASTQAYRYLTWLQTGMRPEHYLRQYMGVDAPDPKRKVHVLLGSESDQPGIEGILACVRASGRLADLQLHIVSCHRHLPSLIGYVGERCQGADVVVGYGGMAFAQPGITSAIIRKDGLEVPVIGVARGQAGTEDFEAARLSIKCLPDRPVVLDEKTNEPYINEVGLNAALLRCAEGEFPPPRASKAGGAKFNVPF